MKIAYLLESVGRTGGNVVLFKHMDALAAAGHEVQVVTPYGCTPWRELRQQPAVAGFGYQGQWGLLKRAQIGLRRRLPALERQVTHWLRPSPERRSRWITERLIRFCPPSDLVVATHALTTFAAARLGGDARAFHHMQGYEPWFSGDERLARIIAPAYHLPLSRIANCSWLADHVRQQGGTVSGTVFPGVDHQVFRAAVAGADCAAGLDAIPALAPGISSSTAASVPAGAFTNTRDGTDPVRILSYCDPRPLKGWAESVAAMERVFARAGQERPIEWHVFGHGSAAGCPVPVQHHGFLTHAQLADLYRAADVLFLPSWFESFPLQPVEAMACGTAVVTTRIGTEDFAWHERTALVVEPRAPEQLAAAILRLIDDPGLRCQLACRGQEKAADFTWERSAEQLLRLLGLADG